MSCSNVRKTRKVSALLLSTILASGLASPALAQFAGSSSPPVRSSIDENGVDVILGNYLTALPAVSVGPQDRSGLQFSVSSVNGGWMNGLVSQILSDPTGTIYTVTVNGSSDRFTRSGLSFTPTEGNGSTLTLASTTYTYTARDGTIATFNENSSAQGGVYPGEESARSISIVYPDGNKVQHFYKTSLVCVGSGPPTSCNGTVYTANRLQTIQSSAGYQLKFYYAANTLNGSNFNSWSNPVSVKAINNASEACNPITDACTLNSSWPTVNLAYSVIANGGQLTVTDDLARTARFTIDSQSKIMGTKRFGATSDNVTLSYIGDKVSSIVADGVTHNYTYSDASTIRTTTVTDANGGQRVYVGDTGISRLLSYRNELNQTTSYSYDGSGRITQITYPEGNKLQLVYDARGNVTQTRAISKTPGTPPDIVANSGFDSSCLNAKTCNQVNWRQDPSGNQTDYAYDATHGGTASITLPAATTGGVRPQTRFTYSPLQAYYKNSSGSIVASGQTIYSMTASSACQTTASCVGSQDELKTTFAYGPQIAGTSNNLRPISISAGSGDGVVTAITTYGYDVIGNNITVDGPLSGSDDTTRYRFDAVRRAVGTIAPDPDGAGGRVHSAVRINYNADDQVTSSELGTVADQSDAGWSTFASAQQELIGYDTNARPIKSEIKSGSTIHALSQTNYDALGRLDCTAQRTNPAIFASLSASACTLGAAGSDANDFGADRIVKNNYDAASQIIKVQTAYGTTEQSDEVTTAYTNNGRTEYVVDAESNRTDYSYDGHDRMVKTEFPSATKGINAANSADYEQFGLDANGNITSRRMRDGNTIGYGYDNLNRLTSLTPPSLGNADQAVSYTYDNLGRLLSAAKSPGHASTFTYDVLGRKTSETGLASNTSYQYDVAGRRTRMTWSDGFFVDYSYLTTGELLNIREYGTTSGLGVLATYGYDDLGRRTSLTRGNGMTTNFAYDGISRLTSLTHDFAGTAQDVSTTFAFNPSNQIASATRDNDSYAWGGHYNVDRSYGSNGLNQLTSSGSVDLGYDGRGNLTNSGSTTYEYGLANNMWHVPWVTFMHRDAFERLSYNANEATLFGYDGSEIVTETAYTGGFQPVPTASAGAIARRFIRGPGADEILVWYEGSGTGDRRWLAADERGSTVAVANDSGGVTSINRYDEYGIPAATNSGRFQYTGQAWIPSLGLYDYKARNYSPTLGRFMQTDPIGYGDGMNWYNYVGSDPVNKIDPSGLDACIIAGEPSICVTGTKLTGGASSIPGGGGTNTGVVFVGQGGRTQAPPELPTVPLRKQSQRQKKNLSTLEKVTQCGADQLGLLAVGGALAGAGANFLGTRGKFSGTTPGTSAASRAASAVIGDSKLPRALPTLTGFPGIGNGLKLSSTLSAARFAARAVPVVGYAILAYDAIKIAQCVASDD